MSDEYSKIKKFIEKRPSRLRYEYESDYDQAAVLLPLLRTDEGPAVLFQVRSATLDWQPGEICFPGGRMETGETAGAAALRETCEELSVAAADVEIYGPLDSLAAQMGMIVHPYVGRILAPEKIKPSRDEVAEVFTVPFERLLDMRPRVGKIKVVTQPADDDFPYDLLPGYFRGPRVRKIYDLYFYQYGKHVIWGLTARILHDFLQGCLKCRQESK
ncbi:MAG: CoA pyrophosphatase [Acidaminococcales bacterium]|jgi:8-oxo-dGTP pyrophosphatase MutT (NUDIX family)|nr:CoA pyrophosphatase [Acidaminococcales bacterium]